MGRLPAAVVATVLAAAGPLLPPVAEARAQIVAPLDQPASSRVRGLDHKARALLGDGRARSATFRRLCDRLEQGDLIVLVESRSLRVNLPARTSFVTDSASVRIVRITLALFELDDVLLAWLGHELQHAIEIASAPEVFSAETLWDFYRAQGQVGARPNEMCTREAQKVRTDITYELAVNLRPGR